jgi:hypothetical protein
MGKRLLLMFVLFFAVGLGLVLLPVGTASAQEICDNGIDDNKDTLVDCKDPLCANDPACKKPQVTADCSPGFYKNNKERWCGVECPASPGTAIVEPTCSLLVIQLSSELGSPKAVRDAAKAVIDACFGTAAASPCTDDD